jgi:IS5 family transposase
VRVRSRLLRRAKEILDPGTKLADAVFRSRTRSVRRLAQEVHRVARRKGEEAAESLPKAYARLIRVAAASAAQAAQVREALKSQMGENARRLVAKLAHFLPLVGQAITQATRRVIDGEVIPAKEKLLSLFEPHTQIIVRPKAGQPTEFGRKLLLDAVDGAASVAMRS